MSKSKAPEANAWHHHERVHIQAVSGDMVLVQYVRRNKILNRQFEREGGEVKYVSGGRIYPWAWLPIDDVLTDRDLDALVVKMAAVA